MHSTKGLEFDIVIVSAWEEGNFPRKVYSDAALEEDRRLAYVTFTRARDMFVATVARQRPNGRRQPSRFLNEIGDRKSVVWGKSVSVRVYRGGRRTIIKKMALKNIAEDTRAQTVMNI